MRDGSGKGSRVFVPFRWHLGSASASKSRVHVGVLHYVHCVRELDTSHALRRSTHLGAVGGFAWEGWRIPRIGRLHVTVT